MQLNHVAAVAAGSAIGGAGRYLVGTSLAARASGFPIATLAVNVAGGLAIGLLARVIGSEPGTGPSVMWLFLATGICGGFTTFSAFSLESVRLLSSGQAGRALLYIGLSVGLALAAAYAGTVIGRGFARS